jgi:hypothetical protein
MTEDQIERKVQLYFDRIDAKLMRGDISQQSYDMLAKEINVWAEGQYANGNVTWKS